MLSELDLPELSHIQFGYEAMVLNLSSGQNSVLVMRSTLVCMQ